MKKFITNDILDDFAGTARNLVTLARPNKSLFGTVKISDRKSRFTIPPDLALSIFPSYCFTGKPCN